MARSFRLADLSVYDGPTDPDEPAVFIGGSQATIMESVLNELDINYSKKMHGILISHNVHDAIQMWAEQNGAWADLGIEEFLRKMFCK